MGIGDDIQPEVKGLEEPDNNGRDQDNRKSPLQKVF